MMSHVRDRASKTNQLIINGDMEGVALEGGNGGSREFTIRHDSA